MKILTVIGARPQFIKASVVSKAIQNSSILDEKIIHTGQHFDANMSNIFFDQLGIPKPHYQLDQKMNDDEWLKQAGLAARRLAEEEFDRDTLATQLMSVLELTIQGKVSNIQAISSGEYL